MKKQTGITLISLVVTIIILLILAGVAISLLTGEEGLIDKTIGARDSYNAGMIDESNKVNEALVTLGQHTTMPDEVNTDGVYAILYSDGLLNFNNTGNLYSEKAETDVVLRSGNIKNTKFEWLYGGEVLSTPWYTRELTITSVNFETKISPIYTSYWFYGFNNLEITNLNNLDTSNVIDMSSMFTNSKFTRLDLSSFNVKNVENMAMMFSGCSSLTDLNLSSFNINRVKDMKYMFYGCESLDNLNLNNFYTGDVTEMSYMFSGCNSLITLDLSRFNTSSVEVMRGMFSDCSSLIDLNLISFNTSKVSTFENMFSGCNNLISLDLSGFNTSSVEIMHNMFSGCGDLSTIYVSDLWSIEKATGFYMFSSCTSLPGYNSSKTNIMYANYNTGYFIYKEAPVR